MGVKWGLAPEYPATYPEMTLPPEIAEQVRAITAGTEPSFGPDASLDLAPASAPPASPETAR